MRKRALIVKLDSIPVEGLEFTVDSSDADFAKILAEIADPPGGTVEGEAQVRLEAWPDRVDVTGKVLASTEATCVRCLNVFPLSLERDVLHILLRNIESRDEEEGELRSSDLDRSELSGSKVDVGEILREELLLAVPAKTLCDEDCKGICSGCGAELNSEECSCEPEIDDRWAALAALKPQDN
jgi:uncharacterized protein